MIGYFGKLPGNADFISYRATSEDLQAFDECLQVGIRRLMEEERWEMHFDGIPRCSFLFRASPQRWLVGEMASSRDASGRRYPLMTFQRLPYQVQGDAFQAPWTLCEVNARCAGEIMQDAIYGHGQPTRFADALQALRPLNDGDLNLHQRLHARLLQELRLCDISEAMSKGYPEFIASAVLQRMTGLRQLCERAPMPPVVLPLPAEQALMRPMADIWTHWLTLIAPAPMSLLLLVHDFMRPRLLAFSQGNTSRVHRLLAGLAPRQERFDVLEPFDRFEPSLVQTALPDPGQSIGSCMARYAGYDDRT